MVKFLNILFIISFLAIIIPTSIAEAPATPYERAVFNQAFYGGKTGTLSYYDNCGAVGVMNGFHDGESYFIRSGNKYNVIGQSLSATIWTLQGDIFNANPSGFFVVGNGSIYNYDAGTSSDLQPVLMNFTNVSGYYTYVVKITYTKPVSSSSNAYGLNAQTGQTSGWPPSLNCSPSQQGTSCRSCFILNWTLQNTNGVILPYGFAASTGMAASYQRLSLGPENVAEDVFNTNTVGWVWFANNITGTGGANITLPTFTLTPKFLNVTTPNQATFFFNHTDSKTYYWSGFKQNNIGQLILVSSPTAMTETNNIIHYPVGRNSIGTSGVSNDLGSYAIAVTESNQFIDASTFIICNPNSVCVNPPNLDATTNASMLQQINTAVTTVTSQQLVVNTTAETRSYVAGAAIWAYSSPLIIPNMYWVLIIALIVAIWALIVRGGRA